MKFDLCETCGNTLYQDGAFGPCGACIDGNNYEQKDEPVVLGVDRASPEGDRTTVFDLRFPALIGGESLLQDFGPLGDLVDPQARKNTPITTGVLDYFPDALASVAQCSKAGNDQHNPGQPLHWDRSKSTDHADCISRHLIQRGTFDTDGIRHSAKLAWRALALLQIEIEGERNRG